MAISYFVFFLGLIINRVISIELFFVWQVSFFSLGALNKVHPILSGMFGMEAVSGYNWNSNKDNRYIPDRINSI